MQVGQQSFSLARGSQTVLSGTSLKDISSICICGIYNFNAYVGSLPAGPSDPLGPDGLVSLTAGPLHVSTCSATPSLGTAPSSPTSTTVTTTTTSPGSAPTTTTTSRSSDNPANYNHKPPASQQRPTTSSAGTFAYRDNATQELGPETISAFATSLATMAIAPSPCTCTSTGDAVDPRHLPQATAGYPLPGEDDSYLGLCSFDCKPWVLSTYSLHYLFLIPHFEGFFVLREEEGRDLLLN